MAISIAPLSHAILRYSLRIASRDYSTDNIIKQRETRSAGQHGALIEKSFILNISTTLHLLMDWGRSIEQSTRVAPEPALYKTFQLFLSMIPTFSHTL